MPGTNAGTGQPLSFRCAKCRLEDDWRHRNEKGWVNRVRLTGRTRDTGKGGVRVNHIAREYECLDCHHVGWSRHNQLARLAEKK